MNTSLTAAAALNLQGSDEMAESEIKAKVWMVSGCMDEQTSADVGDVQQFGLPADVGPGGAGGACTSAMAHKITQQGKQWTWGELLVEMRADLVKKKYTQIPQLSASYKLHLNEPVKLKPDGATRTKALLIGINYVGHKQGVLSGCHNDVETWRSIITSGQHGYDPNNVTVLKDDGVAAPPTRQNIEAALTGLAQGAQPGDALFLQYSGHGSQVKDVSGDEESGFDQVLVPVDYATKGVIIDDWIFDTVVKGLPQGVTLFAVMDCCHSGTILDLPNTIVVTPQVAQAFQANPNMELPLNKAFLKKHQKRIAMVAAAGAAGCCVGGPLGCLAAMGAALCGMAAKDHMDKQAGRV